MHLICDIHGLDESPKVLVNKLIIERRLYCRFYLIIFHSKRFKEFPPASWMKACVDLRLRSWFVPFDWLGGRLHWPVKRGDKRTGKGIRFFNWLAWFVSFDWLGGVTHWPVKRGDKRREKRERAFIGREKMRGKGRRWFPLAPTAAIMKSPYSPSGAG